MVYTHNDCVFEDFCATDPRRLIALPLMPVNHPMDVLLAETERCLKKGARALHIPVYAASAAEDRAGGTEFRLGAILEEYDERVL